MKLQRIPDLVISGNWFVLNASGGDSPSADMFLSGRSLGDMGKSGQAGASRRETMLREHRPDRPSFSPPCLSVSQVHSMDILKLKYNPDASGERGAAWEIFLLRADWENNSYTGMDARVLYRWSDAEFSRRWRELLAIKADGLVTDHPGVDLAVTVSDCMPIFVRAGRWRALLHSGWAGTGILRRLFADPELASEAGSAEVVLGPCISVDNYQVSPQRADIYRERFFDGAAKGCYLDLRSANISLIEEAGAAEAAVWDSCTVSHSGLFSYRQDGKDAYRLMLALFAGGGITGDHYQRTGTEHEEF